MLYVSLNHDSSRIRTIKKESMSDTQHTLNEAIEFAGVGLHTGEEVKMTIIPAAENHGYKFQRIDLEKQPIIKADVDNVVSTERGTTLEQKKRWNTQVSTLFKLFLTDII